MKTYTFEDILAYFLGELDEREKAVFEANSLTLPYVSAALEGLDQLEKRFGGKTEMLKAIHRRFEAGKRCLFAGFSNAAERVRTSSGLEENESIEA